MNPRPEKEKSEWFSDDELWETTYPLMFPEKRFADSPRETDDILALIGCSSGNVLDLACGPARISALLAQRGFAVTGVDRSPFLLARAKERVASLGVNLELVHSDMRDFHRPDSFDIALSLFTSFGYFRDDEENQRVLNNVFANLRAGGVFVLDAMGKETLARIFNPTSVEDIPGGLFIQRRRPVDTWSRMDNEWIIIRDGVQRSFRIEHWIYSGREISQMMARAGFADVRVFGDYAGSPYGPAAKRLVVVATKDGQPPR
jgi:SAM-dependent methyltransferase